MAWHSKKTSFQLLERPTLGSPFRRLLGSDVSARWEVIVIKELTTEENRDLIN